MHDEPGDYLRAVWADACPRAKGVPLQPVLISSGQPPKFRVLDEVVPAGEAETANRLAVVSVRQYRDGSYRYLVGAVNVPEDDRCGLYSEEQLTGTGKRAELSSLFPPAPFTVRDVVAVSARHPHVEVAGKEAEVLSWSVDNDTIDYDLWVPTLEEVWCVEARYLSATGRRLPVPDRKRPTTSLQVGSDGSLLGTVDYFVLEHVEDLL